MYIGSLRVHTPISCTSFRCRSLCIIFASSRKASADIVPGFSVFTATSKIRRHFPVNYNTAITIITSSKAYNIQYSGYTSAKECVSFPGCCQLANSMKRTAIIMGVKTGQTRDRHQNQSDWSFGHSLLLQKI